MEGEEALTEDELKVTKNGGNKIVPYLSPLQDAGPYPMPNCLKCQ